MKNADVLLLNNVIQKIDYTSLEPKDGYKVFKFIREIGNEAKRVDEERVDLIKSKLSEEELGYINQESNDKNKSNAINKVVPFLNELFDQDTKLEFTKMSFESYFALKKANSEVLTNQIDALLENILWEFTE